MRVPDDHPLSTTLALRHADTVVATLDALAGRTDPVTTVGLFELVEQERWAKPTLTAVDRLTATDSPLSVGVLRRAFASRFAPVRLLACNRVREQKRTGFDAELIRVLTADDSWPNRRAALLALSEGANRWAVLAAADDPHWRVRHSLIRVLLGWEKEEVLGLLASEGQADVSIQALTPRSRFGLTSENRTQRTAALLAYLRFAFDGTEPAEWTPFIPSDRFARCPFWDWDPAVLAAKLNRMSKAERREQIDAMPFLAGHDDERVWKPAVDTIRECGEQRHFQEVVDGLDDPRCCVAAAVERLLDGVDEEMKECSEWFPTPAEGRGVRGEGDSLHRFPLAPNPSRPSGSGEPASRRTPPPSPPGPPSKPPAVPPECPSGASPRRTRGRPRRGPFCRSSHSPPGSVTARCQWTWGRKSCACRGSVCPVITFCRSRDSSKPLKRG